MKKLTPLFILALMLSGCSTESLDSEELIVADAKGGNPQNEESVISFVIPETICAGEEAIFYLLAEVGTNLQVQQLDDATGEYFQLFQLAKSTSETTEVPLTWPDPGEYILRYKTAKGFSEDISVTVTQCTVCEETFYYEDGDEENEYVFTYTSEEDIEDALLTFTFAQATAVAGLEDWTHNGNGNSQTYEMHMDIESCETYQWSVILIKDCNGSAPKNNLWTDFKVNDLSKKGDLENITQICN